MKRRFAAAIALSTLTLAAGAALLATSGYLISRAALQPDILSLTVVIVGVRFFALSRAVLRYLERLVSHDASFRYLSEVRVRFFGRLEPLVPNEVGGARTGDLLSRFVADVDALQHLLVRVIAPPVAALVVGVGAVAVAAVLAPQAGLALAVSLVVGAVLVPLGVVGLARAATRRRPAERAVVATRVVELVNALPELVAYDVADDRLRELAEAERRVRRSALRQALATGAGDGAVLALGGVAAAAVLAAAVPAVRAGSLDGVMLGLLALLTLAVFEGVRALPPAAEQYVATRAAAGRLVELTARTPSVVDPPAPRPLEGSPVLQLEHVRVRYGPDEPWVLNGVDLTLSPGRRVALLGPSGEGKTTLAHLLVRFRDPDAGASPWPGTTCASMRRTTSAAPSCWPVRTRISLRRRFARTSSWRSPGPPRTSSSPRSAAPGSGSGSTRCPTGSTHRSGTRAHSSRAESASGSRSRARSSPARRCSCSTSRPRISTTRPRRSCSTTSSTRLEPTGCC